MITVMVAWISFFVMPDAAPARVTLGISCLIAMVLQYGNMASSLPKVQLNITAFETPIASGVRSLWRRAKYDRLQLIYSSVAIAA